MQYYLLCFIGVCLFITSCGTTKRINQSNEGELTTSSGEMIEEGVASWYGPNFHGKLTANGEEYDMYGLTAAHRTLPFNSVVEVQNLNNGKAVQVRINDRGPFAKDRIIDLSKEAARKIGMIGPGTANVSLFLLKGDLENSRTTNLKVATYTVQIASYKEKGKAFSHSQKINGSRVETVHTKSDTFYRVYYGTFLNPDKAREKKDELLREGTKGYVKQIQN